MEEETVVETPPWEAFKPANSGPWQDFAAPSGPWADFQSTPVDRAMRKADLQAQQAAARSELLPRLAVQLVEPSPPAGLYRDMEQGFAPTMPAELPRAPRLTAQDAARGLDVLAGAAEFARRGAVNPNASTAMDERLARVVQPGVGSQIAAGVQQTAAGLADPEAAALMAATAGVGALPRLAQRGVSAGFAAWMAKGVKDNYELAKEAYVNDDVEAFSRAAAAMGLDATFATLSGLHAVKGIAGDRVPTGNTRPDGTPETRPAAYAQAVNRWLTGQVEKNFTPEQVRDMYRRVNTGEATAQEQELVRVINRQIESPGQALRQGVDVTTPGQPLVSPWLRDFLALTQGEPGVRLATRQRPANGQQPPVDPAAAPPSPFAGQGERAGVRGLLADRAQPSPPETVPPEAVVPSTAAPAPAGTPLPPPPALNPAPNPAPLEAVSEVPTATAFDPARIPTVEFPLDRLKLSKDVPNFKGGASEATGTVAGQELTGKYQRTGTAPIVAWERLNGDTEVITGRHRFDLARRTGETTIPTQIVREADGFTKDMALTFDAEANIRDGQGEVADYATYFKGIQIPEAEARARGLLSRAKGRAGWHLAKAATDDVYALWRADKLTDAQAVAIATAAPGDAGAQQIGSKFALQGKPPEFLTNVIKASQAEAGQRAEALDLFGKDDSAMQAMAEQAERASQFQKELAEQIRAVQGAAKRPEVARKLGVDVKDPEGIVNKIAALKAELVRWADWPLQPDLVAKVKGGWVDKAPATKQTKVANENSDNGPELAQKENERLAGDAAEFVGRGGAPDVGERPAPGEIERQSERLVEWARARGLVLPATFFEGLKKHTGTTAEHEVFQRASDQRAIKRTYAGSFGVSPRAHGPGIGATPEFYLRRLALMNQVFDSGLRLEGVGLGKSLLIGKGEEPSLVVSQPWHEAAKIEAPHPTYEQIGEFMRSLGFEPLPKSYFGWWRAADGVRVLDARDDNFILTRKGVVPIDLVLDQPKSPPDVSEPTPPAKQEDFSLAPAESVAEQQARLAQEQAQRDAQAQRDKLAELQAKPLTGTTGDLGQGDLLAAPQDLFAPPSPSARRSGTSAVGDPMMPPIPPGVPGGTHSDARMPVAMERIVPGTVDVPTVMAALEDIVRAVGGESPIRAGRFNEEARGIFKTFSEVIRLRQSDNIPTAAHEVAHAVSKQIFGSSSSRALLAAVKARPVVKELQALGKALYGSTKPAAGYTAEGFSELVRLWITTENAAKAAPAATKWLETDLFLTQPALAQAMQRARDLVDVWRGQGAMGRAQAQMKEPPGRIARLKKLVQEQLGPQASVEAFEPLYDLSKGYEKVTGRKLAPSEDPYLLASAKRRVAGHIVSTMVHDSMLDIWGNPTGPSLKEGLARIKPERETDFAIYLWSRRAIERWAKGKNPGLALEDAQYLRNKLENPDFIEAARKWYQWWDGLLAYVEQAAPAVNGPLIAAIRAGSAEYVPLARVLDEALVKGTVSLSAGGGLQRMQGSGRPIKNIYQQSLLIAERLVERANRDLVLEAVFKLAQTEGMGWLIERVPRQRAMEQLNVEKIRRELESYGVDTSSIPEDTLVKFATHRERPTGVDPIMVRQGPDGPEWYQVPAAVFDALEGVETPARLGPVMDLLFAMPTRVLKMGTTGLRASFSLFTNPARDIPTFMAQSIAGNPASRAMAYFRALGDILKAGLTGKETEAWKTFHRLGISAGNFLGGDIQQARREAKALFRGRVFRRIASPVETLREALSFSEAAPRLAEMGMVGKEFGWEPGKPLTPDAAVAMSLAAKRVTTDFSAAGLKGQVWNQVMPFSNAVIQGTRSFFRAFKSDQDIKRVDKAWLRALLFGLSAFTLPIIWNWWRNKDQEWYRQLPWRERYLYTNVEGADGAVYQVPRPAEWGNLFMVLPEAFLDLWHTRDPEGVQQAIGHIFTSQNPIELPPLAKAAKEQYANRIDFWDRPIIPRGQIDLPPGAQRAEYSSELAKALGNAFPNQVSPRRVDAAIRALLGGVGADLADAPGALMKALGLQERTREPEPADMAIIGRLWRRGGQWSAQERSLMDFWDDYSRYTARARDWKSAMREGRQPAAPMSSRELGYAQALEAWKQVIRIELEIAGRTPDTLGQQRLYRSATQHAKQAVEMRPKD